MAKEIFWPLTATLLSAIPSPNSSSSRGLNPRFAQHPCLALISSIDIVGYAVAYSVVSMAESLA